jgi:hypothetical protein
MSSDRLTHFLCPVIALAHIIAHVPVREDSTVTSWILTLKSGKYVATDVSEEPTSIDRVSRHNPKDHNLNLNRRGNLKCHTIRSYAEVGVSPNLYSTYQTLYVVITRQPNTF